MQIFRRKTAGRAESAGDGSVREDPEEDGAHRHRHRLHQRLFGHLAEYPANTRPRSQIPFVNMPKNGYFWVITDMGYISTFEGA